MQVVTKSRKSDEKNDKSLKSILTRPLDILLVDGPNPANHVGWLHKKLFSLLQYIYIKSPAFKPGLCPLTVDLFGIKTEYHDITVYCPLLPLLVKEWKTFDHLRWYLSRKFHLWRWCRGAGCRGDQDGEKTLFSHDAWGQKRYPKTCQKESSGRKRKKIHQMKEVLLNMESENHPEMTGKQSRLQTFMFRFPILVFMSVRLLVVVEKTLPFLSTIKFESTTVFDRKEMKETTGRKKKRKGEGWKGEERNRQKQKGKGKELKRKEKQPQSKKATKFCPILKTFWIIQNKNVDPNKTCPKSPILVGGFNPFEKYESKW